MPKLRISLAVGDYDRTRPIADGSVQIDGADPVVMLLEPEEIFFRAFRHQDFDVCELSLSSFTVQTARNECGYIGVPIFPSRAFRHTSIYVRTDRIQRPEDLKGRKVGLPEYQLTANVWARAILEHDHGVTPRDIIWVRGGIDQPGRPEKIKIALPPGVILEDAPSGETISSLIAKGEIDGYMAPRPPFGGQIPPHVGWLFRDPIAAAKDYFRSTGIFPIMHLLGVRKTLAEAHPWLPGALLKAFEKAKTVSLAKLGDTSATKVTLPFVEESLDEARRLMGQDFWTYGFEPNKKTLDAFLGHHYEQGLSPRLLASAELFHPSALETPKI
jgi:4,5-dihydroxyphthalate decarboxylase